MPEMYEIFNKHKLNSDKKNIVVFLLDQTLKKEIYSVTYNYVFNTMKILSDDFNLIIVTKNGGTNWTKNYIDHEEFGKYIYVTFDKQKRYGSTNAQEMPHEEKVEYILETFKEMEKNESWLFDNLVGTLSSQFIIPSLDINYEIISDDKTLVEKRLKAIKKYQNGMINSSLVSHCAFIHKPLGFPIEFLIYLMKNYKDLWHYSFCHDTGSAWLHSTPDYNPFTNNTKCFYFIDDNRGIRDFKKYPLTELQDFYGKNLPTKEQYIDILKEKPLDFVFGGLFPFEIDYRVNAWYKFFHDLNVNGIIRTQTNGKPAVSTKDSLLKIEEQKLPKKYQGRNDIKVFVDDILKHKLVRDTIPYDEYNQQLKDSLFTIVLRCYYGKYDSLNFRVANSLFFGTIPLIDEGYDYDNLQIPKHLKDKIKVKSHKDIEDKVKYYRNNPDEYQSLFFELFNYYIDGKYFKEDYYLQDFKSEYFGEIYK